jgi:hypothetical protein
VRAGAQPLQVDVNLPLRVPKQSTLEALETLTPSCLCSGAQHGYVGVYSPGFGSLGIEHVTSTPNVWTSGRSRLCQELDELAFLKRTIGNVGRKRLFRDDVFVWFSWVNVGEVRQGFPACEHELKLTVGVNLIGERRQRCCVSHGRLTVKLSGRAQAPDWSRGRILSPRARGDTTEFHGPLQRLLGDLLPTRPSVVSGWPVTCRKILAPPCGVHGHAERVLFRFPAT